MKLKPLFLSALLFIAFQVDGQNLQEKFSAEIKANSIWWFVKHTNYEQYPYGEPIRVYFFGDEGVYRWLKEGKQEINGAIPKVHLYSGDHPNVSFLKQAQVIWIAKGKEWFALPKVHRVRRYGPCWIITQQDLKNGTYEVRYVMKNGKPVRDAQGNKIKHTIWTMGSMANIHQHPRFGFQGNKSEINRRDLHVTEELRQLMNAR